MDLNKQQKAVYEKMWEFESYRERSPGMRFIDDCLRTMKPKPESTIVDIGCGTGRVSKYLYDKGFDVTAMDIASNACLEYDGPFVCASVTDIPDKVRGDYFVNFDMMEHLPTVHVDLALQNMAKVAPYGYFQIANFVCHEGDKIGESLHLTVESMQWWRDALRPYFDIVNEVEAPKHHLFHVRSK